MKSSPYLTLLVLISLVFMSLLSWGNEPAPTSKVLPKPTSVLSATQSATATVGETDKSKPRTIVPTDPFLTNLLAKPKLQYEGVLVDGVRGGTNSSFRKLLFWKEPGGFNVVSPNYVASQERGERGISLFRIRFP